MATAKPDKHRLLRGFAPASRRAQGATPDHRVEGNGRGEQRLPSRLRRRRSVLCMDDITEPFAAVARRDPATAPVVWTASGENKLRLIAGAGL